jgi:hypothetical protein
LIGTIESAVKALRRREFDIDVDQMPDLAGRIRSAERALQEIRWALNEEQVAAAKDPESPVGPDTFPDEKTAFGTVKPRVVGQQFRTVTTRSCKRSYNTAPILMGVAEVEGFDSPLDALPFALSAGLLTITWKWTPLDKYSRANGLPLKTVKREIADDGDLDGPWVGEVWTESTRQEPVRGDDH